MEVVNFFKFITSKRPEYTMVDAITKGYSVPANSGSTVDDETLSINGLFTTKHKIPNFPDIKSYKSYIDSEVEDFYYVFDASDMRSASYLADIYGCEDYSTMVRLVKYKSGIEIPSLKRKPESPYDIDNITEVDFSYNENIEGIILKLCQTYLRDLSEDDYEDIGQTLNDSDSSLDADEFKAAMDDNLDNFIEYLHTLSQEWCPQKIQILHDYLFDCFRSVAEYQADEHNSRFSLECDDESEYCNIKYVTCEWPLVYLHLSTENISSEEPEFKDGYDKITNGQTEASEGLRSEYVAQYFEKYPIGVDK